MTTPTKPKKGDAVRVNDRFEVHDPVFAKRLWMETGLAGLINGRGRDDDEEEVEEEVEEEEQEERNLRDLWGGEVCGLNPRIRVYRYEKGQFFGQHCT